jgi:hypothetical protein
VRLTWNIWPNSKLEATKCVIPFAALYTPNRRLPNMPVWDRLGYSGTAPQYPVSDREFLRWLTATAGAALRANSLQAVHRCPQPICTGGLLLQGWAHQATLQTNQDNPHLLKKTDQFISVTADILQWCSALAASQHHCCRCGCAPSAWAATTSHLITKASPKPACLQVCQLDCLSNDTIYARTALQQWRGSI